jgi:hypothetical protein
MFMLDAMLIKLGYLYITHNWDKEDKIRVENFFSIKHYEL